MRRGQLLLLAALLGISTTAMGRELRYSVSVRQETACTPSWTAAVDTDLANTLLSGPDGAGSVTITLADDSSLNFTATMKGGIKLESLALRVENAGALLSVPLLASGTNATEGRVDANDWTTSRAVDLLTDGAPAFAEATTVGKEQLVGAFSSNCQPKSQFSEVSQISWKPEEGGPFCTTPGFSQLFVIPDGCTDFDHRVASTCGVQMDSVLLAPAFDAAGQPFEGNPSAVCLPDGCTNPCASELDDSQALPSTGGLPTASPPCRHAGFETFYHVPDTCKDLADRLQDTCYLSVDEVLAASYKSLWLSTGGICLPEGCDPCGTGAPNPQEDIATHCRKTYFYTQAFEIPQGCGDFTEVLATECGLEAEAIAAATGMGSFPEFAGFGAGKTVCLPEFCHPCQPPAVAAS